MSRNYYASGEWNVTCDVCSRKIKSSQAKTRWDGFIVCPDDYETRHPQDFVKARQDKIYVPFQRPIPTLIYTSNINIISVFQGSSWLLSTTDEWLLTSEYPITYQWYSNEEIIIGEINNTFTASLEYLNTNLTCIATVHYADFDVPLTSNVIYISATIPIPITSPIITEVSSSRETATLVTNATWLGAVPMSISYQWTKTLNGGLTTENISGATSSFYVIQETDVGYQISLVERATNIYGSWGAGSPISNIIISSLLSVITPVSIDGSTVIGSLLTATPGTWNGTEPITLTYQWLRDSGEITGETDITYLTTESDGNAEISCVETATNVGGSASQTSNIITMDSNI